MAASRRGRELSLLVSGVSLVRASWPSQARVLQCVCPRGVLSSAERRLPFHVENGGDGAVRGGADLLVTGLHGSALDTSNTYRHNVHNEIRG